MRPDAFPNGFPDFIFSSAVMLDFGADIFQQSQGPDAHFPCYAITAENCVDFR